MTKTKKEMPHEGYEEEIKKVFNEYTKNAKAELNNIIDEQVEFKISKKMKEEEKRFTRLWRAKLWRKNIYILILLLIATYFGYCLYKIDYFKIKPNCEETKISGSTKNEEINLVDKYRYLIDNLQIKDEEIIDLYTKKNLTNSLKLKIAYKNLEENKKQESDGMITFTKEDIHQSYSLIFGDKETLSDEPFSYNNIKFLYYNDLYLGLNENLSDINSVYQILNTVEKENHIEISLIIGLLSENNELLDKNKKVLLKNYQNELLIDYKDKLINATIIFQKDKGKIIFEQIK